MSNENEEFEFRLRMEQEAQAAPSSTATMERPKASLADRMVGGWGGRMALGMASPITAGVQMLGGEKGRAAVAELEAMKKRGMAAEGNDGADVMGMVGSLIPGGVIAKGVTKALPAAKTAIQKILQGGVIGATTSAAQPVTTSPDSDFWAEKAGQLGIGAAAGAAIPLAGQVAMAGKAMVEPFYQKGREAIIGRTLQAASGGKHDDVAKALMQARELVPGSRPTVGQASGNAGIAALERAASAVDPSVTVAFNERMAAQNAARTGALRSISGDDNLMAQAVKQRAQSALPLLKQVSESAAEVNPSRTVSLIDRIVSRSPGRTQLTSTLENVKKTLYEPHPLEQRGKEAWSALNDLSKKTFGLNDTEAVSTARTVMDRVKNGKIDAETALEQLKGISGVNPKVADALSATKDLLKAPDHRLRANAGQLYEGARKNITDLLNAKAGDGSKVNEAISRELSVVMKSLDHQINKAEPAYGQYLSAYTQGSKPINQMDVARKIDEKAVNKLTDQLQPNAYANALSDKTAQQATGFKRATLDKTMTPEQMTKLEGIKKDLSRSLIAQNSAGTVGSDTVKKLAYSNLIDRAGIPTFLREFAPTQIAGNLMQRAADSVYGRANKEISNQLAMTLLDPQKAGQIMRKVGPSRYSQIIDQLMQQGSGAAGTAAGRTQ